MYNETDIPSMVRSIVLAKKAYYSGKPIMNDNQYDSVENELKLLDPNHPILYAVGYDDTYDWWLTHYKE